MDTAMSWITVISLLLALATVGGTVKQQSGADSPPAGTVTASKLATNHNETLVRDSAPMK